MNEINPYALLIAAGMLIIVMFALILSAPTNLAYKVECTTGDWKGEFLIKYGDNQNVIPQHLRINQISNMKCIIVGKVSVPTYLIFFLGDKL